MTSRKTVKRPEAWQVRKIAYGLVAVIVAVLGYLGVLSEIKADQIMADADQWVPILLGVLAPALAASKTHAGSDSTATDADLATGAAQQVADQAVAAVKDVVLDTLRSIPGAVVHEIRAEETGEHSPKTAAASAARADQDAARAAGYIYGR